MVYNIITNHDPRKITRCSLNFTHMQWYVFAIVGDTQHNKAKMI